MNSPYEIHTYTELKEQMHEALLRQHPEWIEPNGMAPMLEQYDARLSKVLANLGTQAGDRQHDVPLSNLKTTDVLVS